MITWYSVATGLLRVYFKLFYHYRVYGTTHLYQGGAILAPNHLSFLDPPLIAAAWPEDAHFLARASLFDSTILGWLLPRLHSHPVQGTAQDIQSMRTICQLLGEGKKVVIFPEGVRSSNGELQSIKPGVAMLALRMNCPIIPVYIKGTFEAWPRHQRRPKLGARITCVFGKPIQLTNNEGVNKRQMQEQLTQQLKTSLEALRDWLEAGAQGEPP